MTVAYPVDVGALLADVPRSLLLLGAALDLEKGGVLALVGQAALEACEHGLGVQSTGRGSHLCLEDKIHWLKESLGLI